jgi:hypothetical protein
MHVLRDVALDLRPDRRRGGRRGILQFAVVSAAPGGIAEDLVRRVQLAGALDRFTRTGMKIGMVLPREEPIGRANLRMRATAVEPERGVVVREIVQSRDESADGRRKTSLGRP